MSGSFTTYISDYSAPFIFSWWTGEPTDITSVLHELGHFTSYYYNATVGYSAADSLDLAEVDSQALVLLLIDDYDAFYGKQADEAAQDVLLDAMYSLLSGCMEDEFQQTIYQGGGLDAGRAERALQTACRGVRSGRGIRLHRHGVDAYFAHVPNAHVLHQLCREHGACAGALRARAGPIRRARGTAIFPF